MKNTDLRDCRNNMIFENETLLNERSGDEYKVRFGYYMTENDSCVYGFYLVAKNTGYYTSHDIPKCDEKGKLKLLNISRA